MRAGQDADRAPVIPFPVSSRIHRYEVFVAVLNAEKKKDSRELSAWTGKLNASHIPGDASFGKATFK